MPLSGTIGQVRHTYECPMRWADLDVLGHVNNVVYVDYLQEARVDLFRANGASRIDDPADDLAEAASSAAGRKVTRSDVHRQLLADGIRRAQAAARYAARFAPDEPAPAEKSA